MPIYSGILREKNFGGGVAIIGSPGAHAVIPIFVMNHNDHMHG